MSGASSGAAALPSESRSGDISYAHLDLFFAKLAGELQLPNLSRPATATAAALPLATTGHMQKRQAIFLPPRVPNLGLKPTHPCGDSIRSSTGHESCESQSETRSRESLPQALSRKTGFFHAFLSYQVASDSDRADALYNKLVCLSHQNFVQVPAAESFYWPDTDKFKRSVSCPVRIFYDKQCLAEGQVWDWNTNIESPEKRADGGGFLGALNKSIVFVPLVSVGVDDSGKLNGSLGRFFRYGYKSLALGDSKDPFLVREFKKGDTIWFSSRSAREHLLLFTGYEVTDVQQSNITAKAEDHHSIELSHARVKISNDRSGIATEFDYVGMKGVCLYHKTDNEACEGIDNVLFEWMFAFALHKVNLDRPNNRAQALFACRSIFPIFHGGIDSGDSPLSSILKVTDLLSTKVPSKTLAKISRVFEDIGVSNQLPETFFELKPFVSELLRFQGFDYQSKTGSVDYLHCCCLKVFSCISMSTVDPGRSVADKPLMQEFFSFLERTKSKHMIPALTKHNICSVADLSLLDAQQRSDLADEISQSSHKSPQEVSLHLFKMIRRAQTSFLSLPLDERFKKFRDSKLSLFTAASSKSALDLLLGKPFFLFVLFLFFAGGAWSAIQSSLTYEWQGTTVPNAILAIGCGAAASVSYFLHPRYGKYTLAVMLALMIGATVYEWYSNRESGFGYCENAQTTNRLKLDHETCDNYLFFVIVAIQLIMYGGLFAAALMRQQYFFYYLLFINTILNLCWLISDIIIVDAPLKHKIQDTSYAGLCFLLFLILLVSRHNYRRKAVSKGKKATQENNKAWKHELSTLSKSVVAGQENALVTTSENPLQSFWMLNNRFEERFKDVMDSKTAPLPPLHQDISNLQELYDRGQFMNYAFQELIESWFSKSSELKFVDPSSKFAGSFKANLSGISGVKVMRGPIKQPARAISKIYRTYGGDVSRLTDVVRCTILCEKLTDIVEIAKAVLDKGRPAKRDNTAAFIKVFKQLSAFCSTTHEDDDDDLPQYDPSDTAETEGAAFEISRIRNRFDDSWKADKTDGYRDLSFKLKVAAEESDCGGCWFVPVALWPKKQRGENGLQTMICELQLKLQGKQTEEQLQKLHATYVKQRDLLSQ